MTFVFTDTLSEGEVPFAINIMGTWPDGMPFATRYLVLREECVVCGRAAPLTDGECPDCCH